MNTAQVSEAADRLVSVVWVQAWQIALVALLVAVLARTVCRRRPHLAYLLWMLVVVKALTPPLVASRAGVFSWMLAAHSPAPVVAAARPAPPNPAPPKALRVQFPAPIFGDEPDESPALPAPEPAPHWSLPQISRAEGLLAAWLLGSMALALYAVTKWVGCRARWRRTAIATPSMLAARADELARQLNLHPAVRRRLRILVSRGAGSPAVFGVWRPTLLLPAELLPAAVGVDQSPSGTSQLDAILAHELIHVRRGDPAAALLQLAAQVAWWFHPLVWLANREARRERERACDEEVVTGLNCRPADYARALLDVLEQQSTRQPAFAVPGVGMLGVTARRLEHLLSGQASFHNRTPRWYYAIACAALLVVLPGAGMKIAAAPPAKTDTANDSPAPNPGAAKVSPAPIDIAEMPPAGAHKSAGPTIIFTQHVILWDKRIVSWEQMVLRLRSMRPDGPIHPHFLFTHGAFQSGVEDRMHKKFFEIYKELFEPAGMSMGSMMWRTSQRLDRIRTEDDLLQDSKRERRGRVLTPEGEPAVGAQVVVVPKKDPAGVTLAGKQLRDTSQEDWVPSDDDGRFTIYPDSDEYVLLVLHSSGVDIRPVPPADEPTTIQLEPWGRVVFTTTGGVKDQHGEVTIHPAGVEPGDLELQVYEVQVVDRPVVVPVPPGEIIVSRSLKMPDNSGIGLPVEKFVLDPGGKRSVAVEAPTAADRAQAAEVRAQLDELRGQAAVEPKADEEAPQGAAEGPAAAEAPPVTDGNANYGLQLVFTPDDSQITGGTTEAEEKNVASGVMGAADIAASPAARKLNSLGAHVYSRRPKAGLGVGITDGWRGTDADLALVAEVPQVHELSLDLNRVTPEALGRLKLSQPLQTLILWPVTDEGLAEMAGLPRARLVSIADAALTARGCARLAELLGEVESLSIACRQPPRPRRELSLNEKHQVQQGLATFEVDESAKVDADAITSGANAKIDAAKPQPKPPAFVGDAGLAALVKLQNLKTLALMYAGITDAGLPKVAELPRLQSLTFDGCPGVTGTGFAGLQRVDTLRRLGIVNMPLSPAGLQAVGKLSQLQHLVLAPANSRAEDFAPLAGLTNLRSLMVGNNWSLQDGPLQTATGDGVLKAAGQLPHLERLMVSAIKMTDEGVEALAGAKELKQLHLSPIVVRDRTLAAIAKLEALQRLALGDTPEMIEGASQLTDAGLAQLGALTQLRDLSMPGTGITDTGLASLAKLKELERLSLSHSSITGSGLAALSGLLSLQSVQLPNSAVDDAGAKSLTALWWLRTLNLDYTRITDAALESVAKLKSLSSLSINGVKVTGDGLLKLNELKNLKELTASGWNVSEEQFAEFKKAHLGIAIHGRDWPGQNSQRGELAVADGIVVFETDESYVTLDLPAELPSQDKEPATEKKETQPDGDAPKRTEPRDGDSTRSPASATSDLPAALARLRELGLEFAPEDPAAAARQLESVGLTRGWKGKADDLRVLNDVPRIKQLYASLDQVDPAVLDALAPRQPLSFLILQGVSDQTLAKINSLPACRKLTVDRCELTGEGGRKLAALAPRISALQLSGPFRERGDNTPPAGITDDVLQHIATMRDLKQIDLLVLGITDAGVAQLAPLEKLVALDIIECPRVHGAGLAKLQSIDTLKVLTLRIPLGTAGYQGLAELPQLEKLWILADAAGPGDFAPLAALQKLRSLSVWSEGEPKPQGEEDEQARARKTELGNALLAAAGKLPELRGLVANGFRPDSAGLAALVPAEKLESLHLTDVEITDAGLAELGRLKKLRMLNLSGSGEPTAAGLKQLAQLNELHNLGLVHTGITDEALAGLAGVASLESLTLAQNGKFTGSGLAALAPLEKLKSLSLRESPFADASAGNLAKLTALAWLDLSGTPITDQALPALAQVATLETLDLSNTAITPSALGQLGPLKRLRDLQIVGKKLTTEQRATLRQALSGVEIHTRPSWDYSALYVGDEEEDDGAAAGGNAFRAGTADD